MVLLKICAKITGFWNAEISNDDWFNTRTMKGSHVSFVDDWLLLFNGGIKAIHFAME